MSNIWPYCLNLDNQLDIFDFFNRPQLLRLIQVNRQFNELIEENYPTKPFIYAQLKFKRHFAALDNNCYDYDRTSERCMSPNRYVPKNSGISNTEFYFGGIYIFHLIALNCCCEQNVINKLGGEPLFCYRKLNREEGEEEQEIDWKNAYALGISASKVFHKNCTEWTLMNNAEMENNYFLNRLTGHWGTDENEIFWKHQVHDEATKKWIIQDFYYKHRNEPDPTCFRYEGNGIKRACPGVGLLTNDFAVIQEHLKHPFVRIMKLDLDEITTYPSPGHISEFKFSTDLFSSLSESEKNVEFYRKKFANDLCWLLEQNRIHSAASIKLDIILLMTLIGNEEIKSTPTTSAKVEAKNLQNAGQSSSAIGEEIDVGKISAKKLPSTSSQRAASNIQQMIAKYDYDPESLSPNVDASQVELSFAEGDIITVYGSADNDGFYLGELNDIRGLVPSNFVTPAFQPPAPPKKRIKFKIEMNSTNMLLVEGLSHCAQLYLCFGNFANSSKSTELDYTALILNPMMAKIMSGPLFLKIDCYKCHPEIQKIIMEYYNPNGNPHRLLTFDSTDELIDVQSLIDVFQRAASPCTYFVCLYLVLFKRKDNAGQIPEHSYYNHFTNEYLFISPITRYSLNTMKDEIKCFVNRGPLGNPEIEAEARHFHSMLHKDMTVRLFNYRQKYPNVCLETLQICHIYARNMECACSWYGCPENYKEEKGENLVYSIGTFMKYIFAEHSDQFPGEMYHNAEVDLDCVIFPPQY